MREGINGSGASKTSSDRQRRGEATSNTHGAGVDGPGSAAIGATRRHPRTTVGAEEAVLTQGGVARQIVSVACTRTDVSHRATAARRVPENQFFRKSYEASNLPVERARGMAGGVVKLGGRAAHRHVRPMYRRVLVAL